MLGDARAQVQVAEMRLARASREHARLAGLRSGTSLSAKEVAQAEDDERIASTELANARERQRLIAEGGAHAGAGRATRVVASIGGTVLATPVAVGDFVSDMNAYRDGTTLAVLADMSKLVFKGQIEEAHVGRLRVGMPARVRVGAFPEQPANGSISWISPRANVEPGAGASSPATPNANIIPLTSSTLGITRFELWIELTQTPANVRPGYTASAELALERASNVVLISENVLRFDRGKAFARVVGKRGTLEERALRLGVSDGVNVALLSGLAAGERVAPYPDDTSEIAPR